MCLWDTRSISCEFNFVLSFIRSYFHYEHHYFHWLNENKTFKNSSTKIIIKHHFPYLLHEYYKIKNIQC